MDEPLSAHTSNELHYYLMVTGCPDCGRGPLLPAENDLPAAGDGPESTIGEATVGARCRRCGFKTAFRFRWEQSIPADADDADCINPTAQPSRIIDLGQWVSLYFLFSESAASAGSPVESRRAARQASLCLAEALKFYGDEELPPASAFFSEASASTFEKNPANFARTHLLDLQAMLPAPAHRTGRAGPPPPEAPHSWWRFWEK